MTDNGFWSRSTSRRLTRRRVLTSGAMAGAGIAGAALIGCSAKQAAPPSPAAPAAAPPSAAAPSPAAGGAAPAQGRPGIPAVKGTPKKGGAWTLASNEVYTTHDPHTAVSVSEYSVMGERAWEMDEWTGKLRPNLVESWEIVDPTHYTLKLRKGINMHDRPPVNGREFDAEDLAFNLMRIGGKYAEKEGIALGRFQRATTLIGMDKVEAVDKYTAKVTMSQPVSTWFNGVTEVRNFMMPRETVDIGFKNPLKFAGMGAFMVTKFAEGSEEVWERFDKYYRGAPHMDKIVLLAMPDRAAQLSAFISKQTSLFGAPTKEEKKSIEGARPDALFYEYGGINWQYFRPHMRVKAMQDARVRRAIRMAINFKEVGEGYHGTGWQYAAAMHPSFPEGWTEDKVKTLPGYNLATKEKDRAEALKLLDAAGFKNGAGIEFELLDKKKADNHENGIRIQGQMQKAIPGMKINLKSASDGAAFNKQQADGEFDVIVNDSTMQPDAVLESMAHFHSEGSRNYGSFKNADLDATLEKALAEVNLEARKEILNTWQQKFMDEWQPLIMLYTTPVKAFVQPNIGGFDKICGPWTGGRHTANKVANLYYV